MSDAIDVKNPIPTELIGLVPKIEQRGKVVFMKADMASHMISSGEGPTEGQMAMVKMMVDLKGIDNPKDVGFKELESRARPAGYAIGFAAEPRGYKNLDTNLFDEGMMVFTSIIEYNSKTAFVGVDKMGVFLIEAGPKYESSGFLKLMRDKFDQVGDQEDNFIVRTGTEKEANARFWNSEYISVIPLEPESIPQALKLASEESLKAPFISPADAKPISDRFNKKDTSDITPEAPVPLAEVEF